MDTNGLVAITAGAPLEKKDRPLRLTVSVIFWPPCIGVV